MCAYDMAVPSGVSVMPCMQEGHPGGWDENRGRAPLVPNRGRSAWAAWQGMTREAPAMACGRSGMSDMSD